MGDPVGLLASAGVMRWAGKLDGGKYTEGVAPVNRNFCAAP